MSPGGVSVSPDRPSVIIVGAGLGGLAAAVAITLTERFSVLVLEAAPVIGEIGAGIQVSPNASRLLIRWGCAEHLEGTAVKPECAQVLRWQDGKIIQQREVHPGVENRFGAPYWQAHRADLHQALFKRTRDLGTEIRTNSQVVDIKMDKSAGVTVVLHTDEEIECAFVVGADGIRSKVREAMYPGFSGPRPTGDLAFRFTVPITQIRSDPILAGLSETPITSSWWGPGKHLVGYPLRGGTIYNVVAVFPDDGSVKEGVRAVATLEQLEELYRGWCPQVNRLLKLADPAALSKWTLMDLEPLPTWNKGFCTLLGDACHPMLPYLAQGSAQAIEDAAALARCMLHLPEQLNRAAEIYTTLRQSRATQVQQLARAQRTRNHLEDGKEQEERDREMSGNSGGTHTWKWEAENGKPAKEWTLGLFGYDAEEDAGEILRRSVTIKH